MFVLAFVGWSCATGLSAGYASSVILELYDGPSGRVLRALRDGKPLVLGVCGEAWRLGPRKLGMHRSSKVLRAFRAWSTKTMMQVVSYSCRAAAASVCRYFVRSLAFCCWAVLDHLDGLPWSSLFRCSLAGISKYTLVFRSVVDLWKDWGCPSPPEVLDSLQVRPFGMLSTTIGLEEQCQASSPMQNSWPGIVALLGLLVCGALFRALAR